MTSVWGALALTILVTSCSTSNDVASNRGIQKRKYTKGYHIDNRQINGQTEKVENQDETALTSYQKQLLEESKTQNDNQELKESSALNETPKNSTTSSIESNQTKTVNQKSSTVKKQSDENVQSQQVEADLTDLNTNKKSSKKTIKNKVKAAKEKMSSPASSDVMTVLLVIIALFIPPLAVFLYEGATTRFWLILILSILAYGVGWYLFGTSGALFGLIAVIWAILIVLGIV